MDIHEGSKKTNYRRRNDCDFQQSDEEYWENNNAQQFNLKTSGYRGNSDRGQQSERGNSSFYINSSKRPLSSNSRLSATIHTSKLPNNNQSQQQSNSFGLNNRLPMHAQNPIFVEYFLSRFSSILPPSKLLAPETAVVETPRTVFQHNFSDITDHSFLPDQNNVGHGFRNSRSKSPEERFLTCESKSFINPRVPPQDNRSDNRDDYFASASNYSSQGYENRSNKKSHRGFSSSYNLPSISPECGGSESVHETFASVSNNVSNRFQKSTRKSSHEKFFEQNQLRVLLKCNSHENANETSTASLNNQIRRVQDNYKHCCQENNGNNVAVLEKGSMRNNSGGQSQCRKDLKKVSLKNKKQNKFDKFHVEKKEEPKFVMSEIGKVNDSQNLIEQSTSAAFKSNNKLSGLNVHSPGFLHVQNNSGTDKPVGFAENAKDLKTSFDVCGKITVGESNILKSDFKSSFENAKINLAKIPSGSSSSKSVSKSKTKVAEDRNKLVDIMKQYGFRFDDHQETFPGENTSTSTSISNPGGVEHFSLGSMLLSQLDAFESPSGNSNTMKLSRTDRSNHNNYSELPKTNKIANHKSNSHKNESTLLPPALPPAKSDSLKTVSLEIPRQVEDISRAVNHQIPSNLGRENLRDFHSDYHKLDLIQPRNNNGSFNSSKTCENDGLTDYTLAGQSFNISQPARDLSHRAPTRQEVLERIEAEYAIKAKEHAEKERLKEAKKRQEYLEKYKYVDQGHKLYEGYLDEAAGYDPNFIESEEDVRQRQQQQLVQDALLYQEQEKENEKLKRSQRGKKKMMNNTKFLNLGHKLGRNNNNEDFQTLQRSSAKAIDLLHKSPEPKNFASDLEIPAELLVEGQSMEEAVELQEQLLKQAAAQLKTEETSKKIRPSSYKMLPQLSENQDELKSMLKAAANPVVKEDMKVPKKNAAAILSMPDQNLKTDSPNTMPKEKLLPKLEKLVSKNNGNLKPKESSIPNQVSDPGVCKLRAPVSCVLNKSTHGPVLVLRPSESALQQAIVSHLEVQDEMDKRGYSTLYKPTVEKALFVHNKFERKDVLEVERHILAPSDQAKASGEAEAVVDLQAEMRAARLRMQQKYEEALKKDKKNE